MLREQDKVIMKDIKEAYVEKNMEKINSKNNYKTIKWIINVN